MHFTVLVTDEDTEARYTDDQLNPDTTTEGYRFCEGFTAKQLSVDNCLNTECGMTSLNYDP